MEQRAKKPSTSIGAQFSLEFVNEWQDFLNKTILRSRKHAKNADDYYQRREILGAALLAIMAMPDKDIDRWIQTYRQRTPATREDPFAVLQQILTAAKKGNLGEDLAKAGLEALRQLNQAPAER